MFLGDAGYCRQWVPVYAALVGPLLGMMLLGMMLDKAAEPMEWTKQAKYNVGNVKTALSTTSALGLPDYDKTFYLYTHKRG